MAVIILECKKFTDGAKKYLLPGTAVYNSYIDFIATKLGNPIARYGSSDKPNPKTTPMAIAIPGISHAHLDRDISIFYTVSGKNPTEIRLYGVLSHDEAGTQPGNTKTKVQKSMAQQFKNSEFVVGGAVRKT